MVPGSAWPWSRRPSPPFLHHSDFPAYDRQHPLIGLSEITRYQLSNPPYSLTDPTLTYVSPLVVSAMMAHYAGDETPDALTWDTIMSFLTNPDPVIQGLGQSLFSLWNDLGPEDNEVSFDLGLSGE